MIPGGWAAGYLTTYSALGLFPDWGPLGNKMLSFPHYSKTRKLTRVKDRTDPSPVFL